MLNLKRLLWLTASTVTGLSLSAPDVASACSTLPCDHPARFAIPSGQVVPENFGELAVSIDDDYRAGGAYAMRMWEASAPERLLFDAPEGRAFAAFGAKLVAGHSYVMEAKPTCMSSDPPRSDALTFQVGPASPPPTELGPLTLVYAGPKRVPVGGGTGCYDDVSAVVADLSLDPMRLPGTWRELLTYYQLYVDGNPFVWELTSGVDYYGPSDNARGLYFNQPGAFRVWTACKGVDTDLARTAEIGVAPGKHTVWVRARVPSLTPVEIESEHLDVELTCPASSAENDAGASRPPDSDSDAALAAEAESSPASDADDETEHEAQADEAHPQGNGGCSLSSEVRDPSPGAATLLLGLALALKARLTRRPAQSEARRPTLPR